MHHTEVEETPWKSHGAYTSTNAKGNTAHPSYAQNTNPYLQTHTYLEVVDTLSNSEFNVITTHSAYYSILCADLGRKPVTDVNNIMADIDTTPHTHLQGITDSLEEGLQDDKS
jgi:hypothetical protein